MHLSLSPMSSFSFKPPRSPAWTTSYLERSLQNHTFNDASPSSNSPMASYCLQGNFKIPTVTCTEKPTWAEPTTLPTHHSPSPWGYLHPTS